MRYPLYSLTIVALLLLTTVGAWSQGAFTRAELDELLGPIALYPDPLIAQILPASTFPDQLQDAYSLVQSGRSSAIDYQPWDVSVRAVAHYPSVLRMLATNQDWTIALGQAYLDQPADVMNSIQRLRVRARSLGYLTSNSYQTVAVSGGYISIIPAQPRYVYVPTYQPSVVYERPRTSWTGTAIGFGLGLLIGSWLNRDVDWNRHRVYYHGWHGRNWTNRSRPHVRVNDRRYVNPSWANRPVTVNRDVRSRDISRFRSDVRRNAGRYSPPGVTPSVPTTPRTRPEVRPRPERRSPGVTGTQPGTRRTTPGTVTPRRTAPVPGAGPRVRTAPSGRQRGAVTPPVTPTRPARGQGAVTTRPVTPRPQTVQPSTRSGRGGAVRNAPSAKRSAPATREKPAKASRERGRRK